MTESEERSLIPLPDRSLASTVGGRVVSAMVDETLLFAEAQHLSKPVFTVLLGREYAPRAWEILIKKYLGHQYDLRFVVFGSEAGFNATGGPAELLECARQQPFDLVVLYAYMFPDQRAFFSAFRLVYGKPVIVMSGWDNPDLEKQPELGGIDAYLPCPLSLERFRDTIDVCINSTVGRAAVAKVDADALVHHGKKLYCQEGDKMSEENILAFKLFHRAAVTEHGKAQFHVSWCYKNGNGIQRDFAEAEKWLRKAAANEYPKALFMLGIAYRNGTMYQGIAKDEDEAIKWLQKAANKGYYMACTLISDIYKERKDDAKELRWTKEAALMGCTDSLWDVKRFYEQQDLARMDLVEAYAWLLLFSDYSPASESKAGEMKALISPPELEKADQLYRDYTKKRSEWEQRVAELRFEIR